MCQTSLFRLAAKTIAKNKSKTTTRHWQHTGLRRKWFKVKRFFSLLLFFTSCVCVCVGGCVGVVVHRWQKNVCWVFLTFFRLNTQTVAEERVEYRKNHQTKLVMKFGQNSCRSIKPKLHITFSFFRLALRLKKGKKQSMSKKMLFNMLRTNKKN